MAAKQNTVTNMIGSNLPTTLAAFFDNALD